MDKYLKNTEKENLIWRAFADTVQDILHGDEDETEKYRSIEWALVTAEQTLREEKYNEELTDKLDVIFKG